MGASTRTVPKIRLPSLLQKVRHPPLILHLHQRRYRIVSFSLYLSGFFFPFLPPSTVSPPPERGDLIIRINDVVLSNGTVLRFDVRFGSAAKSSPLPSAAIVSKVFNALGKKCRVRFSAVASVRMRKAMLLQKTGSMWVPYCRCCAAVTMTTPTF